MLGKTNLKSLSQKNWHKIDQMPLWRVNIKWTYYIVYKIPYRRAWPTAECVARAKVSCIQLSYIHFSSDFRF